ncbi:MAG: hypothetical protein AB1341_15550 [Bacillota bacterium]
MSNKKHLGDWVTDGHYPGDYPEVTRDDDQKAINMADKYLRWQMKS